MPNTSDNNNDNDNDHNNAKQYDNNNNFAKRFRVWGLAQVHAPPQNRTWKVQRPPMVVGGGLEEDVCEVKDTAKQKKGDGSRPVPLTVGKQDLPDPFIRRSKV